MDVKNNLNLVTYCNARTEDVIKLLRTCDDQDDDFSGINEVPEKRHEKRRTTSHFRYQVSRLKRTNGKEHGRKAKIRRQVKTPYPRYRKQFRRKIYSNSNDHSHSTSKYDVPENLVQLIKNKQNAFVTLKIVEIIGEDEPHELDPETIYFITNLLNEMNLIKIRNKVLISALPQRA